MKCTIPEMSWHNRDPVLSVDIQPKTSANADQLNRLASGGSDYHVIIWYMANSENGTMQLELAADLTRHTRAVNVVRWSPSGEYLATGDDDSNIIIWKLRNESEPVNICDEENEQDKETWVIYKVLRGHLDDVYDLSWSPSSTFLISGSVDNSAVVWDVEKGKKKASLIDHKGFVQGVAWDPQDKYLVTLSTDRNLRVFERPVPDKGNRLVSDQNKLWRLVRRLNKSTYPVDESSPLYNKQIRLFHDDTLQTFYRRLSFTPDGELIIVPAGVCDVITSSSSAEGAAEKPVEIKPMHATYIFSRHATRRPAIVIPSADQFTIAVRCCPLLFQLLPLTGSPAIDLPYRMIFAIATKNSVRLYDTQQQMPFAVISNIHYARLTDLAWSSDGTALIVSSFDGFCTLITFEKGELGKVYEKPIAAKMDETTTGDDAKENVAENKTMNVASASTKPTQIETRKQPREPKSIKLESGTKQVSAVVALDIPETIIGTTESFESPEIKGTPATPIAIRREPRTNPSTPTGQNPKATEESNGDVAATNKATPIPVRRQPRNILASPAAAVVRRSNVEHEEALDEWPIPIEANNKPPTMVEFIKNEPSVADMEKTENMRLIYDGDSESIVTKTQSATTTLEATNVPSGNESPTVNDANNSKTPRRVQLRTISTPKSKKKLL